MKRIFFLLYTAIGSSAFGQPQIVNGVVAIHNSETLKGNRQYVAQAKVKDDSGWAKSTITNSKGEFTLDYADLPDNIVVNIRVEIPNLQVVNRTALSVIPGRTPVVKVSMANPRDISQYKYRLLAAVSDASKHLDELLKQKKQLVDDLKLNRKQNDSSIKKLTEEVLFLEEQQKDVPLDALRFAERYARLNLDDASDRLREAILLLQNGKLADALKTLAKDGSLEEEEAVDALELKASLLKVASHYESAIEIFERLTRIDSLNPVFYEELIEIYGRLSKFKPGGYRPLVANALLKLGVLYKNKQHLQHAEEAYQEALSIYRQLAEINPLTYDPLLAETHHKLGVLYSTGRFYSFLWSEKAYKEAIKIYERLAENQPQLYKSTVADLLNNLGKLYAQNTDSTKAEAAFLHAFSIYYEIMKSQHLLYEPAFAATIDNLRLVSRNATLINIYRKTLETYEYLESMYPTIYFYKIGILQYLLANTYDNEHSLRLAEKYYIKASPVLKELAMGNSPDYDSITGNIDERLKSISGEKIVLVWCKDIPRIFILAGWPLFFFFWLRRKSLHVIYRVGASLLSLLLLFLIGNRYNMMIHYALLLPYLLLFAVAIQWAALQICKSRPTVNAFSSVENVHVSDISRVTLLRRRLGEMLFAMKVIAGIFAIKIGLFVAEHMSNQLSITIGLLVFFLGYLLSNRLKIHNSTITRVLAASVVVYFSWFLYTNFRYESFTRQSTFYGPLELFTYFGGLGITGWIIYVVTRGLLTLHMYKEKYLRNGSQSEPLATDPWEDSRKYRGRHPVLMNLWSIKAYVYIIAIPYVLTLYVFASGFPGLLYWVLLIFLYRRGRRHAMLPAGRIMKNDNGNFVLYLRRFMDDGNVKLRARANDGRIIFESFLKITFEELVTDHLWRYGPVIAIGNPNTRKSLPSLGATREFEVGESWQKKVEELMTRSKTIAGVISDSEGFLWEIAAACNLGLKSKLILLLPPMPLDVLQRRWQSLVNNVTDLHLPGRVDLVRVLAVVYRDDQPIFITADKHNSWSYQTALDNAAEFISK
jgi:tetratricopeptide (TPR) repeat protein